MVNLKVVATDRSIKTITQDAPCEKLALLTGLNGSGKTHLLTAIVSRKIQAINEHGKTIERIAYFNFDSLKPVSSQAARNHRFKADDGPFSAIKTRFEQVRTKIPSAFGKHDIFEKELESDPALKKTVAEFGDLSASFLKSKFGQKNNWEDHSFTEMCKNKLSKPWELGDDLFDEFNSILDAPSLLPNQLATLFVAYIQRKWNNSTLRGNYDASALSEKDFQARHGEPPWTVIDKMFSRANLPFKIVPPDEKSIYFYNQAYKLRITHLDNDAILSLEDLSSGEKTLCALALAIHMEGNADSIVKPELLLLDEIDAHLHPSMVRYVVQVIESIIVRQYNVKVIFATHSPTTTALWPKDGICKVSRVGTHLSISPMNQMEAIRSLLDGVPQLLVEPEFVRQVFVESGYDVPVYSQLFSLTNSSKFGEINFCSIGTKKGGGCDTVKSVVGQLRKAGNQRVTGVLDWDGTRRSENGIFIHALDLAHSIENIVLHPCAMLEFVIRYNINVHAEFIDLEAIKNTPYSEVNEKFLLQNVEVLIHSVLFKLNLKDVDRVDFTCSNGFCYSIPKSILHCQGHMLEGVYKDIFPGLKKWIRTGELAEEMSRVVMWDKKYLVPECTTRLFEQILKS